MKRRKTGRDYIPAASEPDSAKTTDSRIGIRATGKLPVARCLSCTQTQEQDPRPEGHGLMEPGGLQVCSEEYLVNRTMLGNTAKRAPRRTTSLSHGDSGHTYLKFSRPPSIGTSSSSQSRRRNTGSCDPKGKVKKQEASRGEKQHASRKSPSQGSATQQSTERSKRPKRQRQLDGRAADDSKINGVLLLTREQQTESGQTARDLPLGNWNFGAGFTPCPGCTLV